MSRAPGTRPAFDRAAAGYDRAAAVQREIAGRLAGLLDGIPEPSAVLEAGCGSGQMTERLVLRFPRSRIDAFDLAPRMLEHARRRMDWPASVSFFAADVLRLRRAIRYELAVSNCALHWATPLAAAFARLAAALQPGGRFAAAVMIEGTLGELRAIRARVAPGKTPGPLPSARAVRAAAASAGLRVARFSIHRTRTRHDGPDALLDALRATGVTGAVYAGGGAPLNRKELRELTRGYAERHGDANGRVPATWTAALLLARKPGPESAVDSGTPEG